MHNMLKIKRYISLF